MNKSENKTPFWYKTSFMVIAYAVVTAIVMLIQFALCLCLKFNWQTNNIVFADFINGNLVLPMQTIAWFWMAISAAYIGVDRAAYAIKTANERSGQSDMGDPSTIRRIILISGLLTLEALVCNGFADADFELDAFFTAFGSAITLYVTGQKAIKSVKYIDGKIDANGDGIPDEEQDLSKLNEKVEFTPKPHTPPRPIGHNINRNKKEEEDFSSKDDVL